MDAEALLNCEGYEKLRAMRDSALAHLTQRAAAAQAQINRIAAGGHHARHHRKKLDELERRSRYQINQLFDKLARGFDPKTGTSSAVQDEAEAALAAIFS